MQIAGTNVNGYQLRLKRGQWWLQLWYMGKDLRLDYGPFGYYEALAYCNEYEAEFRDIDKQQTSEKVNRENEGLQR